MAEIHRQRNRRWHLHADSPLDVGGGPAGRFHIEVDGVDRTGALTVPDASGWQAWRTLMVTGVPLGAGQRVIRLVLDSDGTSGAGGKLQLDTNSVVVPAAPSRGG